MELVKAKEVVASFRLRFALVAIILLLLYGIFYWFDSSSSSSDYEFFDLHGESYNLKTIPTNINNITPESHYFHTHPDKFSTSPSNLIQSLPEYERNKLKTVLYSTEFSSRSYASSSGFVKTAIDAYRNHHNLVIRPDDIWAAIITQFSFYVNKNGGKLSQKFVHFEGRRGLRLKVSEGSIYSVSFTKFVTLLAKEIDRNLVQDSKVKEWIMPSFSTTTQSDYVSIGMIFMATMKRYFEYELRIHCGIPNVVVDGTVEDWKDIQKRVEKLTEYNDQQEDELVRWYGMLSIIIRKFVEAKEGKVDEDFWKAIVNKTENMENENGLPLTCSAQPSYYISGWITAFCVFDQDGNWQESKAPDGEKSWPEIKMENIPRGVIEVDVTLDDHDRKYKSVMLAGHMAVEVKKDGTTLQPALGWAVVLKSGEGRRFCANS